MTNSLLLISLLYVNSAIAQSLYNYIDNGNFESYPSSTVSDDGLSGIFTTDCNIPSNFLACDGIDFKNIANYNGPFGVQVNSTAYMPFMTPESFYGKQYPHSGNNYAGVFVRREGSGGCFPIGCGWTGPPTAERGELAMKFKQPLQGAKRYVFEGFCSKMDANFISRRPDIRIYISVSPNITASSICIAKWEFSNDGKPNDINWERVVTDFYVHSGTNNFEYIIFKAINKTQGSLAPFFTGLFIDDVAIYDHCTYINPIYNSHCSRLVGNFSIYSPPSMDENYEWRAYPSKNITSISLSIYPFGSQSLVYHKTFSCCTGIDLINWNGKTNAGGGTASQWYNAYIDVADDCNTHQFIRSFFKFNDATTINMQPEMFVSKCDYYQTCIPLFFPCCEDDLTISNVTFDMPGGAVDYSVKRDLYIGPNVSATLNSQITLQYGNNLYFVGSTLSPATVIMSQVACRVTEDSNRDERHVDCNSDSVDFYCPADAQSISWLMNDSVVGNGKSLKIKFTKIGRYIIQSQFLNFQGEKINMSSIVNVNECNTEGKDDYNTAFNRINSKSSIKIWPNPFDKEINILPPIINKVDYVYLYNSQGKLVNKFTETSQGSTLKLSFNEMPEGIYLLGIYYNGTFEYTKVIHKNE
ncbi:MAG TPA: T9SS type A sorting domain-containing protein [Bacteroidia bacterium]|nr:T9SS type A sorting domain-containing protein [Bacteroidia bacterium]HNU34082.1 T9SS type A sorting domain-containing protein [Bacteroidia bacterium]